MKRSLIALAIASIFTAPAAMADDVKIYGKADMGIGSVNNGTTSTTQVSSQVTKIGFKGSEDLGGGVSAVWQIEQQIDIDGGSGSTHTTFAGRNSFLGLKSDAAGTILLGRHDTPYKEATRHMDVFGDQMADNRSLLGGADPTKTGSTAGYMDARTPDTLMYISPKLGGMATIEAAYVASAETSNTAGAVKGSAYSLAGIFDIGPVRVAAAYQPIKYSTAGDYAATAATLPTAVAANDEYKASKVGASYAITDGIKVNAVYEKYTSSGAGTAMVNDASGQTNAYVGAVFKVTGSDAVKVAYGKAGKVGNVAATGAHQMSVGYDHDLTKSTKVYAQYTKISNDAAATYGISSGGTTLQTGTVVAGKSVTGLIFGVYHSF
jgi:predicted porin